MKAIEIVCADVMKKPVSARIAKKKVKLGEIAVRIEKMSPKKLDQNSVGARPRKDVMGTQIKPPKALEHEEVEVSIFMY